jgi:hypothetical protein
MATTLALAMRASMSATGVVSGANQAADAMDKMGRQAKRTAGDVSTLKTIAIGQAVASGVSALSQAFMSAGQAALSYTAGVANAVDQTNDMAERLGFGVEALQSLQMAAKLSGVEDATGALQKMTVAIGKAVESGETDAFDRLGLSLQNIQAMSPEEQFRAIQSAIAALPTPAERAAAAVSLFGRSGVELLPLMSKNLTEVEQRMKRLGAVIGDDQVEGIGAMNDALDAVKMTFDGIVGTVVGNLAPIVESITQEFLSFVEAFDGVTGTGGGGIAGAITEAMLDIADYLAGVFDNAVAGFDNFAVSMADVGASFEFVGNVFTAVAETLRLGFNLFEMAGNVLALGLGKFLEGLGSWVSTDLESFGRDMQRNATRAGQANVQDINNAGANAAAAASNAVFGGNASTNAPDGPAGRAVDAARKRMAPEEQARRTEERAAKQAEQKSAREAAAAADKAKREAEAEAKRQQQAAEEAERKAKQDAEVEARRQEQAAKQAAGIDQKIAGKEEQISGMAAEKAAALDGKSNEQLRANDIRSSEGIAQFLALATGREDPAIEENRKTNLKLEEIRKELRALQAQKVEILGAA